MTIAKKTETRTAIATANLMRLKTRTLTAMPIERRSRNLNDLQMLKLIAMLTTR
jgi:hypothetical protein